MRQAVRVGYAMILGISVLLGACGDSDGSREPQSLAELGVEDGASKGVSKSLEVTADTEAVIELPTGAKLAVPKGAVDGAVTLTIARPKDAEALQLVKTVQSTDKVSSAPYVFTPHGTQFKKGVEVTLPVAKDRNSDKLVVAWLSDENDKEWKTLGKPRVKDNAATIELDHFSVLVLLERDGDGDGPSVLMPGDVDGTWNDGGFGNRPGSTMDAGPGPGDTVGEGFAGDSELIGTWDVTMEDNGETFDCTAQIDENLSFTVDCDDGAGQYDVDCDYVVNLMRITGTFDVGSGSIQAFDLEQFSGPGCASYDLTVGELRTRQEMDGELTRLEAGIGKLGGKWTAAFFEWGCPGDQDCEPAQRARREGEPALPCDFELDDTGKIQVFCKDKLHEDETLHADGGVTVQTLDCWDEATIEGSLGGGEFQVTMNVVEVGSECETPSTDTMIFRATRR